MFRRDFFQNRSKQSKEGRTKGQLPALPPRDGVLIHRSQSTQIDAFDPESIVFEPYVSSSDSASDNENLSEEVISVSDSDFLVIVDRY